MTKRREEEESEVEEALKRESVGSGRFPHHPSFGKPKRGGHCPIITEIFKSTNK